MRVNVLFFLTTFNFGIIYADFPRCNAKRLIRCTKESATNLGLNLPSGLHPLEFADFRAHIAANYPPGDNGDFVTPELCGTVSYAYMHCMGDQLAACSNIGASMAILGYDEENARLYKRGFSNATIACAVVIEGRGSRSRPVLFRYTRYKSLAIPDWTAPRCQGYWIYAFDEYNDDPVPHLFRAVCNSEFEAIRVDGSNRCGRRRRHPYASRCLNLNPAKRTPKNPLGILEN